jgi:cytochrome c biogenesis protein CcdA
VTAGSIAFGFLAGMLSTLSPCVLPLLPLILGAATASHRLGLPALAAGVVVSFVSIGLFVATIGFAIGLDGDVFRSIGAILLAGLGVVLLSAPLQNRFALAAGSIGNAGNRAMAGLTVDSPTGQFVLGLLLGAASVLASQRHNLGSVAAVMLAFGIGTAIPLLAIGLLSREALMRWRGRLMAAGQTGKRLLGATALVVSLAILTGFDRKLEIILVKASPSWLSDLTTRF